MVTTVDYLYELISSLMLTKLDRKDFSAENNLSELGIDSLTTLNIIITGAQQLKVDISNLNENMEAPRTVGDIMQIFHSLSR